MNRAALVVLNNITILSVLISIILVRLNLIVSLNYLFHFVAFQWNFKYPVKVIDNALELIVFDDLINYYVDLLKIEMLLLLMLLAR